VALHYFASDGTSPTVLVVPLSLLVEKEDPPVSGAQCWFGLLSEPAFLQLAKAEPKRLRFTLLHTAGGSAPPHVAQRSPSSANGPGPAHWPTPSPHFGHSPSLPETRFAEDENVIASALPHAPPVGPPGHLLMPTRRQWAALFDATAQRDNSSNPCALAVDRSQNQMGNETSGLGDTALQRPRRGVHVDFVVADECQRVQVLELLVKVDLNQDLSWSWTRLMPQRNPVRTGYLGCVSDSQYPTGLVMNDVDSFHL
jgi:hypothetical protein